MNVKIKDKLEALKEMILEYSTHSRSFDPYLIENLYKDTAELIFEKQNSKPITKEQQ